MTRTPISTDRVKERAKKRIEQAKLSRERHLDSQYKENIVKPVHVSKEDPSVKRVLVGIN